MLFVDDYVHNGSYKERGEGKKGGGERKRRMQQQYNSTTAAAQPQADKATMTIMTIPVSLEHSAAPSSE